MEVTRAVLNALEDAACKGLARDLRGENASRCAAALVRRKNSKAAQRHRARRAGFRVVTRNGKLR